MAGRPKQRAEMVMMNQHADEIFSLLEEGKTQNQIAAGLGVMRSTVTRWLNANESRKQALAAARTLASDGLAEETLEIADAVKGIDNAEVQAAKLRIETRRHLAGVWNAERYGEKPAGVTVNIGTLHLQALRQAGPAVQPIEQATPANLLDAPDSSESGIVDVQVREAVPSSGQTGL